MRGHVAQKGNRWYIVVEAGADAQGRRRQKWHSGFATRKEAEAALPGILARSGRTLGDYLRWWLEIRRGALRPSTWDSYRSKLEVHVLPRLGRVPLQSLRGDHLDELYAEMLQSGLAARSVRYTHAILHKALSDGVRKGRLLSNPANQADPPRPQLREMRCWTAEETARFLTFAKPDPLYPLWVLAATTGMRRGELLGLRWEDTDLEGGRLAVRRSLVRVNGVPHESAPKTARGRRSVALDPTTVAVLRAHGVGQAERRLAGGRGKAALVFSDEAGEPLRPDAVSKRFGSLAHRAGLPRIRFHDLRHTHASLSLAAGVHPKVVSERLGHASIVITLDTYSHAIPSLQEEAAGLVAALVFGGSMT